MLPAVFGVILLLVILIDVITTTLSLHGGGWLTKWLIRAGWLGALKLSGNNGRSRFLDHVGYILLLLMLIFWVLGLWVSFVLILLSEEGNIVNSANLIPVTFWDKVYYAGYTISSLGNGEFIPNTTKWRMIASIFSFTGIIMITLSITYLVPALSAVLNKSKLSIYINSMGHTPSQILLNGWNGQNFNRLIDHCATVAPLLIDHSQNHRAYPVIHYFHSSTVSNSVTLRLATLFEALILLKYFVRDTYRPDMNSLSPIYVAFVNYLELSNQGFEPKNNGELREPVLDNDLLQSGLVNGGTTSSRVISEKDNAHRRTFTNIVGEDGWNWEEISKDQQ